MPLDTSQDQVAERLAKLEALREAGIDPYPHRFPATDSVSALREAHGEKQAEELERSPVGTSVAGRVLSVRRMGKAGFIDLSDGRRRLQVYVRRDDVTEESLTVWKLLDIGDWLGVHGSLMRTRTGELSVKADEIVMLSKALRPLPIGKVEERDGRLVVHHAMADKELRYRQRHLDLMANLEVREVFELRSKVLKEVRAFLDERGFVEVETPILQVLQGGATARPFETSIRALSGLKLYLRIAEELHLKRLIAGGFERVYELGRVFRNEGIDRTHNPEFTMLELYQAHADYGDMAELMESMVARVARQVLGRTTVEMEGETIELAPPWRRITMLDAIREVGGVDADLSGLERSELLKACESARLEPEPDLDEGKLLDFLFEELVQPRLVQPTFVLDYPLAISPLAKMHRSGSVLTERFEPFVAGWELGNAFSELNDPIDQRERFERQARLRAAGDEEAQPLDEEFLTALEHGMPPTGGLGVGIDRLVMLLSGRRSIRDVILFPFMRPLDSAAEPASDEAP